MDVSAESQEHASSRAAPKRVPDPAKLLRRLRALRATIDAESRAMVRAWRPDIRRLEFAASARNLAHYLSFRARDLRALQSALMPWGLSSLGRSEGRVLGNLDAVIGTLAAVVGDRTDVVPRPSYAALTRGERRLRSNTDELFGPARPERAIRIMVTLPREAGDDPALVADWVRRGMDCARINCAHDDEDVWARMVANVKRGATETGRTCRVAMDLCGPRLRTSEVRLPTPARHAVAGDIVWLSAGGLTSGASVDAPGEPVHPRVDQVRFAWQPGIGARWAALDRDGLAHGSRRYGPRERCVRPGKVGVRDLSQFGGGTADSRIGTRPTALFALEPDAGTAVPARGSGIRDLDGLNGRQRPSYRELGVARSFRWRRPIRVSASNGPHRVRVTAWSENA